MSVYSFWNENHPDGVLLGMDIVPVDDYGIAQWCGISDCVLDIVPTWRARRAGEDMYIMRGHYVNLSDLLYGDDSLKFVKKWPRDAQLEAGKFLRRVWQEWRRRGYSKQNMP